LTSQPPPPPPPPGIPGGGGSAPPSNPLIGYWKLVVLERYALFQGRAGRPEFWWFTLANVIVAVILNVLAAATSLFLVVYVIYALALIVPSLAVAVRRLHDTDKSGWWILISLVPFVGGIILIVFLCLAGTPGPNRYGVAQS